MNETIKADIQNVLNSKYIDWIKLKNCNFFITGATGLVASLLVKTLATQKKKAHDGGKIYILVRSEEKAKSIYEDLIGDSIILIQGDVREKFTIGDHIDYVIHAASITTSKYMVTNPVETLMTSILGTYNTLEFAKEHGVKGYIYISSMEVYGVTDVSQNPITEDKLGYLDVLNVRSSYSEGKRACENMCVSYFKEYALPIKIARLAQIFGAGVRKDETKVFASFAKSALMGQDIVLHTNGETMGNYCYTSDCVGALLCLLTKGNEGESYNIVNEDNSMEIKNMAKLVAKTLSFGKSKVIFDIPENQMLYGYAPETKLRLCGDKIRRLGWIPTVSLTEMYERMVDGWK